MATSIHGLLPLLPIEAKGDLPPLREAWEWVDLITLKAISLIEEAERRGLQKTEMLEIQDAIIAR
jgi:hypothetical protein